MPPIPIFYSSGLSRFNFGPGHPFSGDRFEGFVKLLDDVDVKNSCKFIPPVPATEEDLELIHTREYLRYVRYLEKTGGMLTMDTPVTKEVIDVQAIIAGSGLQAADLIVKEEGTITAHTFGGFHHAGKNYGEGFCVYNDVAIVAKTLVERHNLERIMILDTDAHQGNGTMDIFYHDPRVLFVSIHQDPRTLYPGKGFTWETGLGDGKGFTVNLPMPPYAGNRQYEHVFDMVVKPLAREYKPQMIIRNGGSDPYFGDELTVLGLNLDGLNMVGGKVREIVSDTSGKLLDMMVSGYGNMVLYGWLALFCGIEGLETDYKGASPTEPRKSAQASDQRLDRFTEIMINEVSAELRDFWSVF
jgi:acetoin utilization protein AcuC